MAVRFETGSFVADTVHMVRDGCEGDPINAVSLYHLLFHLRYLYDAHGMNFEEILQKVQEERHFLEMRGIKGIVLHTNTNYPHQNKES